MEEITAAEEPSPPRDPPRWLVMVRSIGMGLAMAGVIGIGWRHTHPPEPTARFCTADGYVTNDGVQLVRDPDRGCAWVDPDGNLVTVTP